MGLVIDIYRYDLWLAGFHLLMLAALIYALVRIGRHPGPSICVILAIVLDYAAFLLGPLSVVGGYDIEWFLMHGGPGRMKMVAILLLCVAAVGWLPRRSQAMARDHRMTPSGPEAAGMDGHGDRHDCPVGSSDTCCAGGHRCRRGP